MSTLILLLSCICFYFQMFLFALLAIFRVITLFFFSTYDTSCIIYEHASVSNCHQDVIIPHGSVEVWILVWVISSLLGSAIFLSVCYNIEPEFLSYQREKARLAWKKGSFISIVALFLITLGYYIYRSSIAPSGASQGISVALIFWLCSMVLVMHRLNYMPRVQWKGKQCCSPDCLKRKKYRSVIRVKRSCSAKDQKDKQCCSEKCSDCQCCCCECCRGPCCSVFPAEIYCVFYWIAIITFFLEVMCMWVAVALDAAHEVAPLIEKKFEGESRIKGALILLLGFSMAFHSNLLSFFWNKIFHGDKDLLSEPCSKLTDPICLRVQARDTINLDSANEDKKLAPGTAKNEGDETPDGSADNEERL